MQLPRVSVVMPSYNPSGTIREAIDGALAQALADLEVLVVDGSSDATAEIVVYLDARPCCAVMETWVRESLGRLARMRNERAAVDGV